MAALLAVGTTTASSDDFTLTGEATSLFLVAATAPLSPSAQARWADLTPPTLAECEQFCAGVTAGTA